VTEAELLAILESEERNSLGWGAGELNAQREEALKYYNQEPYGNEQEGRSQVVTSEVADTIEWMLPSLVKIFVSTNKAVEFEPERPSDELAAKQATDVCNYIFYRQNNGFLVLYTFFKDALQVKNGYVKVYPERGKRKRKEMYRGLTEMQLAFVTERKGVEVTGGNSYPDPMAPPPAFAGQPAPTLYDVQVEITEEYSKTCVVPIPPEEILISKALNCVDLRESPFVAHRCEKTVSELRGMGYEVDDLASSDEGYQAEATPEYLARREFGEDQMSPDKADRSMRRVWVTEAYIRVDYDGDGVAELRKIIKAGHRILENEEADVVPIAAITPTIMTHRHFGRSIYDWIGDLQLVKSTLLRQVLDNVYLTNNPRKTVLADPTTEAPRANLSDLMSARIGGIVRQYVPGAVTTETTPFMGQHGLQMMEYLDTVKDSRVGFTGQFSGLDADALNKTARGATLQQTNAMQKIEMIARVFAETGVKRLFQLILHCTVKYGQGRPLAIRLRDRWEEYDPTNWDTEMDMTVNVGLGTGDKDQQLVHLQSVALAQKEAVAMGGMGLLVTPKNIYNAQAKIVENAGFKNVEDFWTDPGDRMPQPQPDPKVALEEKKVELDAQLKQQDMAFKREEHEFDMAAKQQQRAFDLQKHRDALAMEQDKMQMGLANDRAMFAQKQQFAEQEGQLGLAAKQADADIGLQSKRQDMELRAAGQLEKITGQLVDVLQGFNQAVARLEKIALAPRVARKDPKTGTWRGEIDAAALQ